MWVCGSTSPGKTRQRDALTMRLTPSVARSRPIAAICSPAISRSPSISPSGVTNVPPWMSVVSAIWSSQILDRLNQPRQYAAAGAAQINVRDRRDVVLVRVDVDDQGATARAVERQRSCRLYFAGRAGDEHGIAAFGQVEGTLQRIARQHLAKPDDLGPQQGAAARAFGRHLRLASEVGAREAGMPAVQTSVAPDAAVQLDHIRRAGGLVQTVDVLRNDGHLRQERLEPGDGQVSGVRRGLLHHPEAVLVPLPDQGRIAQVTLLRRQVHGIVTRP